MTGIAPAGATVRGIGIVALGQVMALVAGLVGLIVTSRALGAAGQGIVAVALVVPYMGQLLFGGGLPIANLHLVGARSARPAQVVENGVVASLGGAALAGTLLTALMFGGLLEAALPGVEPGQVMLATLALPFLLLRGAMSGVLRGLKDIGAVAGIEAIERVVYALGVVGLVLVGRLSIESALVTNAVAATVGASLVVVRIGGRVPDANLWHPRPDAALMLRTLRLALPSHLGNLLQFLNYRLDLVLVGLLSGPHAAGLYSVAVRTAELLLIVPNAAAFVHISRSAGDRHGRLRDSSLRLFWASVSLCVATALGAALTAQILIPLVFGNEYVGAVPPLLALLPGIVALAGAAVLANDIAGRGRPGFNAVGSGAALVVTVALDLALIPAFGPVGAALASSCAYLITLVAAMWGFARVTGSDAQDYRRALTSLRARSWAWARRTSAPAPAPSSSPALPSARQEREDHRQSRDRSRPHRQPPSGSR